MPAQQTVVRLTVGPTDTTYTSLMWKAKDRNNGHLSIGPVHVEIPQHLVTLHDIMTRSTKQITSTLMEFNGTRILYRGKTLAMDDSDLEPRLHPAVGPVVEEESHLIKPLVMTFQLVIESFAVSAALLPSLQAQYLMEMVSSKGVTGSKAKFSAILPKHTLNFTTKLESSELREDTTLPSAWSPPGPTSARSWSCTTVHSSPAKQLLYTVSVELERITITATTPSNSAVRFETVSPSWCSPTSRRVCS